MGPRGSIFFDLICGQGNCKAPTIYNGQKSQYLWDWIKLCEGSESYTEGYSEFFGTPEPLEQLNDLRLGLAVPDKLRMREGVAV